MLVSSAHDKREPMGEWRYDSLSVMQLQYTRSENVSTVRDGVRHVSENQDRTITLSAHLRRYAIGNLTVRNIFYHY